MLFPELHVRHSGDGGGFQQLVIVQHQHGDHGELVVEHQHGDGEQHVDVEWDGGDDFVVDELDVGLVVVVVVDDVLDLLPGLKIRSDSPTKISTAIPMVTNRRMLCLRLAAFCSDSRRACRPAF